MLNECRLKYFYVFGLNFDYVQFVELIPRPLNLWRKEVCSQSAAGEVHTGSFVEAALWRKGPWNLPSGVAKFAAKDSTALIFCLPARSRFGEGRVRPPAGG